MNSKLDQMMDQDFGLKVYQLLKTGVFMELDMFKVKPDFQRDIMTSKSLCSKTVVALQHTHNTEDLILKTNGNSFMSIIEMHNKN